jgi:sugar phosphate isomerase/epimerase
MLGTGMFSWFSYDLPILERLTLIKDAGFDTTSLWWAGDDRNEQPDMARKIGLQIDNIHTPFPEPNRLWLDGLDGDDYQNMLISCVEDCCVHEIPVAVIHLTSFREKVPVTDLGLKRIGKIIDVAERKNIKLAFENLTILEHLDAVLTHFSSPYVGFCYDSGHENLNPANQDCLALFGDRLFALHIDDNFGDDDSHMLPFDGNVNWQDKMQKLKQCRDVDYFTLEVDFNRKHEKCVIYKDLSAKEYLESAYAKAVRLLGMGA